MLQASRRCSTRWSSARAYAGQDQLFATLDTTTRHLYLGDAARQVSISDTVGFIRDLPHGLVDAFKATLQEAVDADLLLHVVDASNPHHPEQMAEVQGVLREIGADKHSPAADIQRQARPRRRSAAASFGICEDEMDLDGVRVPTHLSSVHARAARACAGPAGGASRRAIGLLGDTCRGHDPRGQRWNCTSAPGRSKLIGTIPPLTREEAKRMNAMPVWSRLRGMFNLNDGRWGRGDDSSSSNGGAATVLPQIGPMPNHLHPGTATPPPPGNNHAAAAQSTPWTRS